MSNPFAISGIDLKSVAKNTGLLLLTEVGTQLPLLVDPNIHYSAYGHDVTWLVRIGVFALIKFIQRFTTDTTKPQ